MRISDIISPRKEESILSEAARFGDREKGAVLSQINNFKFGIEYEFNVSDRFGAINYVDSLVNNPKRMKFAEKADGHVITMSQAYEKLHSRLSLDDLVEYVGFFKDALNGGMDLSEAMSWFEEDKRLIQSYFSDAIKIIASSMALIKLEPNVSRTVGIGLFKNNSPQVINVIKRVNTSLQRVNSSSNQMLIESFAEDFIQFVDIWSSHLRKEVIRFKIGNSRNTISEVIDDELMKAVPEDTAAGDVITKVEWVAKNIKDYVTPQWIESVVPDVTVGNGVEVVSKPLSFDQCVKFMDEMFSYIAQVGGKIPTDGGTGLHLNVSYNGSSFTKMNAVKAMTLMDDMYQMYGGDGGVVRWPRRISGAMPNHIIFLQQDANGETFLHKLAKTYVRSGAEAFIDEYEKILLNYGRDEKYSSFNIKNFINGNVDSRRVEWRVMGGSNYHQRRKDIIHDMLNVCYVILAGMDESFLRKEYLQSIVRMLNKIAAHGNLPPFIDLISQYR